MTRKSHHLFIYYIYHCRWNDDDNIPPLPPADSAFYNTDAPATISESSRVIVACRAL